MAIVNFANRSTSGFDEDVLTTAISGEHVLNFGYLTSTGDLANGIFAGANDVGIRNFGQIETSGDGAAGIYVQGENAHIENFGSVRTTGNLTADETFFSEGLFAEGDGFYIANYGSVSVEGESSSCLVGAGADGVAINYGRLNSVSFNSSVIAAVGDRSQAINAGLITIGGDDIAGLFALGEHASALNRGEILVTGDGVDAIEGVVTNTDITNRGEIRITADGSTGMGGFGDGHEVSNFGLIETHGTFNIGMVARGGGPLTLAGLDLEVVNDGRIITEGDLGIGAALGVSQFGFRPAEGDEIINRGVIATEGNGAAGIVMIGDGHHLINSGRITTDGGEFVSDTIGALRAAGVVVSGDDVLVENTRSGVIRSDNAASAAVELNVVAQDGHPTADMSSRLENFGLISGASVAILGSAGEETVVNHGRIVGDVDLGDGADTFVFARGGSLAGHLTLGGGNDFVRIEDGSGTSSIADFAAGASSGDVIDVSEFFSSFSALQAHSHQRGNNVVVDLDHNDTLVLEHVHLNALNAGDFFFV